MQWPQPGFNFTPAYQISGLPYALTGTATSAPAYHVQFPYVTKFITVKADGGSLKIGFTANGVAGTNYFSISNNDTVTFEVRVKEMYIDGAHTFHIIAGLTGIPTASIPTLTGSYPFSSSDPYFTGSNSFTNVLTYEGIG
jgi:hypothetical protein